MREVGGMFDERGRTAQRVFSAYSMDCSIFFIGTLPQMLTFDSSTLYTLGQVVRWIVLVAHMAESGLAPSSWQPLQVSEIVSEEGSGAVCSSA